MAAPAIPFAHGTESLWLLSPGFAWGSANPVFVEAAGVANKIRGFGEFRLLQTERCG
jgi:hypothetical protein